VLFRSVQQPYLTLKQFS